MKNRVLFLFFCLSVFLTTALHAQNKTLGVGATTPNQNAALHVESPTNNQGFIMPRLTTAQRLAMSLASDDIGLLVYDRDLQEVVSWNGTEWADAGTFLSSDTTATLYVVNNGTIAASDVAGSAAILAETTNAFSAITGRIPASASGANAISGITRSTNTGSWAGYFDALTGTAVYGTTSSNAGGAIAPVGVYGESRGTGSLGGAFWIQNAANNFPALYTNTIGTGTSLSVNIDNSANTASALFAQTNGTGPAGHFEISNPSSGSAALFSTTQGTGAAFQAVTSTGFTSVYGRREGTAPGNAGLFEITDAANNYPALQANTAGDGNALNAQHTGANGDAIFAQKTGTAGGAGNFLISNSSNTTSALHGSTNATGGIGIAASNSANGLAFAIMNGGMRVNTADLRGMGATVSITQRAVAYLVDENTYTFDVSLTLNEGDIFYFVNTGASAATVNGIQVPPAPLAGKTLIYLGGALREF